VLVAATVVALPRPPALDGSRWMSLWMATLLRGSVERDDGSPEDWAAAVARFVPWHPAGRLPERKIVSPQDPPPSPALDGELALQQALAELPDAASRWARLYDQDTEALAARLTDPQTVGEAYDPATWFGAELGWEAVAQGPDGPLGQAVPRLSEATWVIVGERLHPDLPPVEAALLALLGEHGVQFDPSAPAPEPPQAQALRDDIETRRDPALTQATLDLLGTVRELAPEHGDHLVLVGVGEGMQIVLEALRASAVLRDQVLAVLSLGGIIGGLDDRDDAWSWEACTDWLQEHFRHDALDLEAAHRTPFLAVQFLDRAHDPPGAAGLPLERARFPEPAAGKVRRESLETVDLGVIPVDPELPVDLVALALWGTVTGWIRARGP